MKNLTKISLVLLCGLVLSACSLGNKEHKKTKNSDVTTSEAKKVSKITMEDGKELETVDYVLPSEYKNIEWLNKSGDFVYFSAFDEEDYHKYYLVRYHLKDKTIKVLDTVEKGTNIDRQNLILTEEAFVWSISTGETKQMKVKYILKGKDEIKEAFPGKTLEKYTNINFSANQIAVSYYDDDFHTLVENIETGEVKEDNNSISGIDYPTYNYNRTATIDTDYENNKKLTIIRDLKENEEYIVNPPLKKRDYDYMESYLVGMDYLLQVTELRDDDDNDIRCFITDIKSNKAIELEKDFFNEKKYSYRIVSNSRYFVLNKTDFKKTDIGFYELKKNKLLKHTIDKDDSLISDLYVSTDDEILLLVSERNENFEKEYKLAIVK